MWHQTDNEHVLTVLCVLGQTLSTAMVDAGLTSFRKIEQTNPRELELVSWGCFKKTDPISRMIYLKKNVLKYSTCLLQDFCLFFLKYTFTIGFFPRSSTDIHHLATKSENQSAISPSMKLHWSRWRTQLILKVFYYINTLAIGQCADIVVLLWLYFAASKA